MPLVPEPVLPSPLLPALTPHTAAFAGAERGRGRRARCRGPSSAGPHSSPLGCQRALLRLRSPSGGRGTDPWTDGLLVHPRATGSIRRGVGGGKASLPLTVGKLQGPHGSLRNVPLCPSYRWEDGDPCLSAQQGGGPLGMGTQPAGPKCHPGIQRTPACPRRRCRSVGCGGPAEYPGKPTLPFSGLPSA